MSDCRYGVSPVNYPDPDPDKTSAKHKERTEGLKTHCKNTEIHALYRL